MGLRIEVVKKPSGKAIYEAMLRSVQAEWHKMDRDTDKELNRPVSDWRPPPEYYAQISVRPGKWRYGKYHRSQKVGGQRYNWVRLGTGLHGPKRQAYAIFPKQAGVLRFTTPHSPKTLAPGQSMPSGPKTTVFTMKVNQPGQTHPGIKPRNDTKGFPGEVYNRLFRNTQRNNSFLQRTRKACLKSFRRK